MTTKSKYETSRIKGWDEQISKDNCEWQPLHIVSDEVIDYITENATKHNVSQKYKDQSVFTDDYLDFVYEHSAKIKLSEENKKAKVFPDEDKP